MILIFQMARYDFMCILQSYRNFYLLNSFNSLYINLTITYDYIEDVT